MIEEKVNMDRENRNPELENKFNLHIGKPYRVQVQYVVHDGIMNECEILMDETGFRLMSITLEDGLFFDHRMPWEKFYMEGISFSGRSLSKGYLLAFQSIGDEEGFKRARDRIKEENKK